MPDPIVIELASAVTATVLLSAGAALAARRYGPDWTLGPRRAVTLGLMAAALYAAVFGALTLRRYEAFNAGMVDFGGMDQAIWNSLHGRFLEVTSIDWGQTRRLVAHVEPTFVLLSPVYLLWDDPRALLLLQTLLVASGAVPVFLWARRHAGGQGLALAAAAAYLLFPALQYANRFDFHGDTIAVPFLLWAFLFFSNGNWVAYWIAALLAMGSKEYIPLMIAGLGFTGLFTRRSRLHSAASILVGMAWFLVAVAVVIPAFARTQHPYYMSQGFAHIGGEGGLKGVLDHLIHNPMDFATTVVSLKKAGFIVLMLAPVGFLSLLAPRLLVPGLPILGILLLHPSIADIRIHHPAPLIPVIVLAAVAAMKAIERRLGGGAPARRASVTYLIASAFLSSVFFGASPLAWKFWAPREWEYRGQVHNYRVTEHDRQVARLLSDLPDRAPVSSSIALAGHLGHREYCWCFPQPEDRSAIQAVAVDLLESTYTAFWPRRREQEALAGLMADARFTLTHHLDGALVFERTSPSPGGTGLAARIEPGPEARCSDMDRGIRLQAFDLAVFGSAIKVQAQWSCCSAPGRDLMAVTTLTDGERTIRYVHLPSYILRPMGDWQPGQGWSETFEGDLPPGFENHDWEAAIGLFPVPPEFSVLTEPADDTVWNRYSPVWVLPLGRVNPGPPAGVAVSFRAQ